MHGSSKTRRSRGFQALAAAAVTIAALAAGVSGGVACNGTIGDPNGKGPTGPSAANALVADHSRFPRLSHKQWENTVQDLFHLDAPTGLSQSFYPDALGGKAFDNNESVLQVTPELWGDYEKAAEEVATMVANDPAKLAKILPTDLPTDPAAKKTAFLKSFGLRAFRRPITDDELATFGAIFDMGAANDPMNADPFVAGARLAIEAFLQSPFFLYKPELTTKVAPDGLIHLGSYEVASKLSYTLWNTMPDDALMASAAAGDLETKEGVEAKLKTMLDDPRAKTTLVGFHHQLYDADEYVHLVAKNPTLFPSFDPAVGDDMRKELDLFVGNVIDGGGGLKELLTSSTTFVNSRLAPLYGVDAAGKTVSDFQQVSLDPSQRAGILTLSGFLAWKGTAAAPDTIMRGVFINRRILCQTLGDPPPAAMGAKLGSEKTDRERVEALTGKGTCGESCHGSYIDPVGYAFENYDAVGQWRTDDGGVTIDASSSFPFDGTPQSYMNAPQFAAEAAGSLQANTCYAKSWLEFAYGRDPKAKDSTLVDEITALSRGGGSTRDIVIQLLTSDSFLTRTTEVEQ